MKVLVVSPGVLPVPANKGGAVEKLIEEYIEYNENNHKMDFTLYTIRDEKQYNCQFKHTKFVYIDNTKIIYKIAKVIRYIINNKLPKIHIGNVFISKVIKQLKKDHSNYDVIIVENIPFNVLALRKLYPKTKIIYHIHNDYLNHKTKKAKKILENCDKIIAISDFLKSRIETIKKTDNICVVYNGIEIEKFNQPIAKDEMEEYKKRYQIDKNDILFLYTGRIVPGKGVKELIIAFCKILQDTNNLNLKLLIVGSKAGKDSKKDRYMYQLIKLASKYRDNIIFTGYIPNDKLPIIYQMCHVQVVPSKEEEALGIVAIEGMASGIKQIVTNNGGLPEVVRYSSSDVIDKENIIKNLYQAMSKIVKNKDYRKGKTESKVLEKFSQKLYSENMLRIIENKE